MIINPFNGAIEMAKVFDTNQSCDELDRCITKIHNEIPKGYIIIAACRDDCEKKLSKNARLWFTSMGSKDIWKIGYRYGFAFIGINRSGANKACCEKVAMS